MKAYNRFLVAVSSLVLTLVPSGSAFAQAISTTITGSTTGLGNVTSLPQLVAFLINLFRYLGWIGVILGVAIAIFALIYKLMGSDNEETMANVQGYITKAVIIVVVGILLLGFGFIINVVGGLFNFEVTGLPSGAPAL